jgi:DNA-binding beta-propeller fold protein YncE
VSADGSKLFLTGSTGMAFAHDYLTVAYNASTGAASWSRRYNGPANGDDGGSRVAVDADGSKVFVTGGSDGGRTNSDYLTIAYDAASGAKLWNRRYDGPASNVDAAYGIAVSPDGSDVFVTGASTGGSTSGSTSVISGDDYLTIAYDASTGAALWHRRYDTPTNDPDVARSVAVSPDGSKVFVTGESIFEYLTVAYSAR